MMSLKTPQFTGNGLFLSESNQVEPSAIHWQSKPFRTNPSPSHTQSQSGFFSLPGELRNQIYADVFTTSTSEPDALSLLATCRLVYNEAAVLAFASITFVTRRSDYYFLSQSTSQLPYAQFAAITHIAYETKCAYDDVYGLSTFMTNAAFHFPGLRTVTLRVRRKDPSTRHVRQILSLPGQPMGTDDWFAKTIKLFMKGRPLVWPKDRPWSVEWPDGRPESNQYEHWVVTQEEEEEWMECIVSRSGEGEDEPETRVEVRTEFVALSWRGDFVPWEEPAEKLPVTVIGEASRPTGIQWDGSPEWWEEKRKKAGWFKWIR